VLLALAVFCAGCGAGRIETAADLAAALKTNGVAFEQTEPSAATQIPGVNYAESIRLRGAGLDVEIIRVADQRSFDLTVTAVKLGSVMSGLIGSSESRKMASATWRDPFVVVVYEEPRAGPVGEAVRRVFPDAEPR
jgi:nucleotide-binding universal stress UspA family protein